MNYCDQDFAFYMFVSGMVAALILFGFMYYTGHDGDDF